MPYVEALGKEMGILSESPCPLAPGPFSSLYLGGGTPSQLTPEALRRLFGLVAQHVRLAPDAEVSIEANPETLTDEKIAIIAKNGVNRASLGVQSFSRRVLRLLGRRHDKGHVDKAVMGLRKAGIDNINLDWIYGVKGESPQEAEGDLSTFLSYDVPHISCYSLIVEEGTPFSKMGNASLDDDAQQGQFEIIEKGLAEHGYHRYEVSSFCKKGHQCRHNMTYWKDERYVAIGLGASGYEGNIRYKNTTSMPEYLQGHYLGESDTLSKESEMEDFFLTNLRLSEGFALGEFRKRFDIPFFPKFETPFLILRKKGILMEEDGFIKAGDRGLDFLDETLRTLFAYI